MTAYFPEDIKPDLIKLGLYQIIGGLVGIAFLARSIFNTPSFNEITILIYLIISLFFCYSMLCGWICVKFNKSALIFSLINQCLQLPAIYIGGLSYSYVAGFHLNIGIDFTESFKINFDAGISNFNFYLNNQSTTILFNFNLIAFYLVYWVERLRKQVKLEYEIKESDSIGEDLHKITEGVE